MSRLDALLSVLEFPADATAELNERCDVEKSEVWEVIDRDPEPFPGCLGCEDGCKECAHRRYTEGKWRSGSMPAVRR